MELSKPVVTFKAMHGTTKELPVLSCIFDQNCTELFKAIEERKWSEVAYFIDHAEWPSVTVAPDVPPAHQVETVVSGYDEETQETWTYLPLHMAIVRGAPLPIIDRLVTMAPDTVTIPDHDGNLALHLSLWSNSQYKVQDFLIKRHKPAIGTPNQAGLTPVQCALASGSKAAAVRGKILNTCINHARGPAKLLKLNEIELFCDYATDCSPLFKKIEQEAWDSITMFLTDGKWSEDSWTKSIVEFVTMQPQDPDASHPKEQVMTLVTKCEGKRKIAWARLPLHLAILRQAPVKVIHKLVEYFPESLTFPDHNGCLPLHLALESNAKDVVVSFLLSQFPAALRVRDAKRRTPLDIALKEHSERGRVLHAFVAIAGKRHVVKKGSAKE